MCVVGFARDWKSCLSSKIEINFFRIAIKILTIQRISIKTSPSKRTGRGYSLKRQPVPKAGTPRDNRPYALLFPL